MARGGKYRLWIRRSIILLVFLLLLVLIRLFLVAPYYYAVSDPHCAVAGLPTRCLLITSPKSSVGLSDLIVYREAGRTRVGYCRALPGTSVRLADGAELSAPQQGTPFHLDSAELILMSSFLEEEMVTPEGRYDQSRIKSLQTKGTLTPYTSYYILSLTPTGTPITQPVWVPTRAICGRVYTYIPLAL